MKSRAQVRSHPIHPMLVAFPIAFLYGGLGFDLAGRVAGWSRGWETGAYLSLAAIASGLVAAVPGVVDYLSVVPPGSSARSRATKHMLVNVAALASFAVGWAFREGDTLRPGLGTLALEALGVGLVTAGGWLGGTLVYRNQIGVDHRYAGAGKWKETTVEAGGAEPVVVAKDGELEPGQMKLVHVGGRRVVLARTDEGYAAFDDFCTHKGGPLSDGSLVCGVVQCPWHGSQFDAKTGAVKAGPAKEKLGTYRVEVVGGEVRLASPVG